MRKESDPNVIVNTIFQDTDKVQNIDIAQKKKGTISLTCGMPLLKKLRNNNCTFLSLLSELIDNVAAELNEKLKSATVEIFIYGPWSTNGKHKHLDLEKSFIEVCDNATGIKYENLGECLSLASKTTENSLHEHCMGMKTAIISLGTLDRIITRSNTDAVASRVNELKTSGDVEVFEEKEQPFTTTGTFIKIKNLTSKVYREKYQYEDIADHIGARYASLIEGRINGQKLEIVLKLGDEKKNIIFQRAIESTHPIYESNKPKIDREISGASNKWCAHFSCGLAASDEELKENKIEIPTNRHPYHRWTRSIDVDMFGRTLCRIKIEEFPEVGSAGAARFVPAIGKIQLRHGFKTAMTKDGVFQDENWLELREKVSELLKPILIDYAQNHKKVIENEKFYRDKLAKMQKDGEEKEVFIEFAVEGTDGKVDLMVGNIGEVEKEVWELKAEQADGQDVYQVLYYVDTVSFSNKKIARLIAPSFSDGCKRTVEMVEKKHGIKVKMKTFDDVGLTS